MKPERKNPLRRPRRALTGFLTVAVVGGILVPTSLAHANDPVPPTDGHKAVPIETPPGNIYKLDQEIQSIPELTSFFTAIDTSKIKLTNTSQRTEVKQPGEPVGETYLASTDVENPGPTEQPGTVPNQTGTTPSVSDTYTTTVTNTVTKGLKLGVEISSEQEGKIPFVGGVKFKETLSTSFEKSWSTSTTDTRTITYTLPAQSVVVPPGMTAHVQTVMHKKKYSGKSTLTGDLVGTVTLTKPCGGVIEIPIGQLMAMTRGDGYSSVAPDSIYPNGDAARFVGESEFSGVIGLDIDTNYSYSPLSPGVPAKAAETKPVQQFIPVPPAPAPPIPPRIDGPRKPLSSLTENACPGSGYDRTIENIQISSADLTNYLDYDASTKGGAVVKDWDKDHTQKHEAWIVAPLGNGDGRFRLLYGKSGLCLSMENSWRASGKGVVVERCSVDGDQVHPFQLWGLRRTNSTDHTVSGDVYQLENTLVGFGGCGTRPYPGASAPFLTPCEGDPLPRGSGSLLWGGSPNDTRWKFNAADSTRANKIEETLRQLSRQWSHRNQVKQGENGEECGTTLEQESPDGWQKATAQLCGKVVGDVINYELKLTELQYYWGWIWYNNKYKTGFQGDLVLLSEDGQRLESVKLSWSDTKENHLEFAGSFNKLPPGEYKMVVEQAGLSGMYWASTEKSRVRWTPIKAIATV